MTGAQVVPLSRPSPFVSSSHKRESTINFVENEQPLAGRRAMKNDKEQPPTEVTPTEPSLMSVPPGANGAQDATAKPEADQLNQFTSGDDLVADLKRRLEETRLPAYLKQQILAELPPPEERERLYRELQEKGGLSVEQFFASLGLAPEPRLGNSRPCGVCRVTSTEAHHPPKRGIYAAYEVPH